MAAITHELTGLPHTFTTYRPSYNVLCVVRKPHAAYGREPVRGGGTVYRDSHVKRAEVWMYNRSIQRFECLPFVWKTRSALHVISNGFIFSGQVIKCLCADRSHCFNRVQRMALKRPTTDLGAEGRGFESHRSDHSPRAEDQYFRPANGETHQRFSPLPLGRAYCHGTRSAHSHRL